ncbi:M20 family metallopeptidase [Paenibacillus koleovorans]|uniref:M20 family metallopeptidase n=1 Tax=Paenibacillus koleovorans TaxID=121608 RepID=UPI0013E2C67F|nr:M20 family metallopeptidase [Paenibacillus koleovorans]
MNRFYNWLVARQDEMTGLLRLLVELESPSADKALNDRIGAYIGEAFVRLTGGSTVSIEDMQYGNHIRCEWGSGPDQILLLGHFDTVWPQGQLQVMPFRIENDKAFGPGTVDMKAGLVQALYAVHALRQLEVHPHARIVLLCTSDEEAGSPSSRDLILEEAGKSKCVLVLESTTYPVKKMITARRGIGIYRLKIKGISAHAGSLQQQGVSSIEELARQIQHIHGLADRSVGISLNVGKVSGGTAFNVVADYAEAEIDLRFLEKEDGNRMNERIMNLLPILPGIQLEVSGGINRYPMYRDDRGADLFRRLQSTAREHFGMELEETLSGGFGDANLTAGLAPTLDGLGCVGSGHHALSEHVLWAEMPLHSALLAQFLCDLSGEYVRE